MEVDSADSGDRGREAVQVKSRSGFWIGSMPVESRDQVSSGYWSELVAP